jgi:multisubunit Na+/H+ antiporter MnhF subunit
VTDVWLGAAAALLVLVVPTIWLVLRGLEVERLAGLELASTLAVLAVVALAEGVGRPGFVDLALVLAITSSVSTFVFVRFLDRGT